MRFLIKLTFWCFLALVILPSISPLPRDDQVTHSADEKIEGKPIDATRFALSVARDVGNLCTRQPDICEVGREVVATAIHRAQDGAQIVAKMVEQHRAEQRQNSEGLTTGSIE